MPHDYVMAMLNRMVLEKNPLPQLIKTGLELMHILSSQLSDKTFDEFMIFLNTPLKARL